MPAKYNFKHLGTRMPIYRFGGTSNKWPKDAILRPYYNVIYLGNWLRFDAPSPIITIMG